MLPQVRARFFRLAGAFSLVVLTAFTPLAAAQASPNATLHITQIDTSRFPMVKAYVSATDANGEPVPVNPNQIVLAENGKPVQPTSIKGLGPDEPLTTMLVIDVSGSMLQAGKLQGAQAAAKAYVQQMRPGDEAGIITFSTQISSVQPITSDRQELLSAIDSLHAEDNTAMYDALYKAVGILQGVSGRKAIIVLTDGMDNVSTHNAGEVISAIGPAGLSISTVGLGEPSKGTASLAGIDEGALRTLADQAGGTYGFANDPSALTDIYQRYGRALQSEYVVEYTSPSTLRDGVNRSLTVSLSGATPVPAIPTRYNPGGLVPEVPQKTSWPLFFGLLAGLLILLFAPPLISRGALMFRGSHGQVSASRGASTRIKLLGETGADVRQGSQPPRIRLH